MGDRTGGERVPGPAVEGEGPPAAILDHLASGTRAGLVEDFARAVLRRVPFPALDAAGAAVVAASVADVFHFVDARGRDAIAVRVVDPPVALDGWPSSGSVVEIGCEDRQFIVTTVTGTLHRLGHRVVRDIHPVYGCERGADGELTAILPARPAARRESFLQVEVADRVDPADRVALVADLTGVLGDLFAATGDYGAMRSRIQAVASGIRAAAGGPYPADEAGEAADLLDWLLDGNFVLTGCCSFRAPGRDAARSGAPGMQAIDALGVLSRPDAALRREAVPAAMPADVLRIVRTAEVSRVHRLVPMHRIDVAEVGNAGEVSGAFRLVGVFTAKANAEPAAVTPILRFKLRRILELEDVVERSQDEAALVSLFQVLPKDHLFETSIPSLRGLLLDLLAAEQQHEVRVLLRADPGTRTVSALVSVPADIYSPAMRHRLERFLVAQLDGTQIDADVSLGDRPEAIVRLVVHMGASAPMPEQSLGALERELRLLCRTWDEELGEALAAGTGSDTAGRLVASWADWFPATYREAVAPEHAVADLLQLDALCGAGGDGSSVRVVLAADSADPSRMRLKVFAAGEGVELSRFLPILESLGLWAVEDRPHTLGRGPDVVHLHDFGVTGPPGQAVDVVIDGPRLAEAALALWHGRADPDYLNRLVLRAGLAWDDVAVLRAYRRYRSLVGTAFTTDYVDRVLVEHAAVAAGLVALFSAMFDPDRQAGPEVVAELRQRVVDGCDAVARLDHDRILRGYLGLVDATLRTSRWVAPGDHLALKFDSAAVPAVPRPVPYREIFVHGPDVEGVHLRWGPVARGGIRWSDRPDDYRSEVLDLMRAQVLKNAVIVPTGAKGGFVVRPPTDGRAAATVAEAYEIFVTGMLQVTDDVDSGDHVVAVPRRCDGDDPYLVVAADRGTATFSDLANRISADRCFWLGDAFASGGSRGYDHKRLGITARGAWVAVRHHFAELGIDVQTEPVTVVGIGDMSGDVFGNAMLRSDRIRLLAAFDHRDVFVDPDPNPAASYAERARLFVLDRSSWQDYDRTVLSPGGGVWSRLDKRIVLSEQAQGALRVEQAELTPAELIRAILRAPVGLLFTGGIGTFVRAGSEPDQDIDDRANAEVRVEGSTVRARVVGEGANLAFTQRARVDYARRGGRINTDAIDNAAGVDISDHEVNLKILLRLASEAGELTLAERDRVLAGVCGDVTAAVLRDCDLQSVALARARDASPAHMGALEALMVELEAAGVVDRAVEALPTSEEMATRAAAGAGLTRPELAVLLAGSKRSLVARLLASHLPDQEALRAALVSYFPASLATRFDHLLDRHRLRRELVASVVSNEVVNRMGATFVTRLAGETGAGPPAVAAAYWIAREVVTAPACWAEIDGEGHTERPTTEAVLVAAPMLSGLLEALARDYLRRGETAGITAVAARDRPALAELTGAIADIGTPYRRRLRARRAEALAEAGLPTALASRWACLPDLEIGPDAADLARATGRKVTAVAEVVFQLGEALGIDRLADRLRQWSPKDRWGQAAWRGLVDDLDDLRRAAANRALDDAADQPGSEAVVRFLGARAAAVGEITRLLRDVEAGPTPSLDAVAVATRAVRRAIG